MANQSGFLASVTKEFQVWDIHRRFIELILTCGIFAIRTIDRDWGLSYLVDVIHSHNLGVRPMEIVHHYFTVSLFGKSWKSRTKQVVFNQKWLTPTQRTSHEHRHSHNFLTLNASGLDLHFAPVKGHKHTRTDWHTNTCCWHIHYWTSHSHMYHWCLANKADDRPFRFTFVLHTLMSF